MVNTKKTAAPLPDESAIRFGKNKLLTFKRYAGRVDLLTALLEDKREYTLTEADSLIQNFMKGRVN